MMILVGFGSQVAARLDIVRLPVSFVSAAGQTCEEVCEEAFRHTEEGYAVPTGGNSRQGDPAGGFPAERFAYAFRWLIFAYQPRHFSFLGARRVWCANLLAFVSVASRPGCRPWCYLRAGGA